MSSHGLTGDPVTPRMSDAIQEVLRYIRKQDRWDTLPGRVTNDLLARWEHRGSWVERFTEKYDVARLVYSRTVRSMIPNIRQRGKKQLKEVEPGVKISLNRGD